MLNPDTFNTPFFFGAAFIICLNIYRTLRDKELKGVSLWHPYFFTIWGFYYVWFFWHYQTMWSFWGNVLVVAANVGWCALATHYKIKECRRGET